MKNLKIAIILLLCLTGTMACTKIEVDPQEFVQKKLIGSWPLKYTIRTIYTGGVAGKPDTLSLNKQVDTLIFTADGNMVRRFTTIISTTKYSIDAAGENITFETTPPTTQKITFVRTSSFGFATETITGTGANEVRTLTEDQLIR